MKKVLSLILILMFLLSFTACQSDNSAVDELTEEKPNKVSVNHPTIKDIVYCGGEGWFGTVWYETVCEDECYSYVFPSETSANNLIVYYKNGDTQTIKEALKAGNVTIADIEMFGEFFLKERHEGFKIIDNSFKYELKQKPQEFYRDDEYIYYFPEEKMQYIKVQYSNDIVLSFEEALKDDKDLITDLDDFMIPYCKKEIEN